ncbi:MULTISPECIES: NUDIX domain-containing protein [unclassified Solwaraspora]|uniref:NUDIX hydrolase n=1 Tax=unclassified Solwaraspora TaxID=2627926 RepID=UPI00248D25EE|nr:MULTISPECIES: NUDIX domain-containing protein [unclassified Solwaraspora]WBB94839.1 NUDIX domain-containing protein [Solwaraspora sp. WMMA2059]WBC21275.1 NUDIX domain-containing protein [Solwaraspora sp. WMMA2080]WJK36644.1 NUDIX domain-containing protein [Solwaraspora sp. WMMA2065]
MSLTVDLVVLTVRDERLHVLLIERGKQPFLGRTALPGGFVGANEDSGAAALRELAEETGIDGRALHLEQLYSYTEPGRDPRGRVVSIAYLALAPDLPLPAAGTDARHARWSPVDELGSDDLAFDHATILADGVERARAKLEYTTLATAFCPPTFTITELRRVYEVVWGMGIDPRNFHRKVVNADDFLVPTGHRRVTDVGRPAALYRAGGATVLYPPMLRSGSHGPTAGQR